MSNVLVCGSRTKKSYEDYCYSILDKEIKNDIIIEGCCPDSADAYSEMWAFKNGVEILHFPSNPGSYLKRNVEMVEKADRVIVFWDEFSYGSCHTIATAVLKNKPVKIYSIR